VLIEIYGDEFANRIWNNNSISISREIRNCVVHNGGKASNNLLKMRPLPHIKDEDIIISASDTRKLYNLLKPLIYDFIMVSLEKV
jgi:hypothetical protein